MIYSDNLWQSVNETSQESKYLQFCRPKAYYQFRIHCLLEAVCYFNFLVLQDPQWLLYVHFKSSSNYDWTYQRPKPWVFIPNSSWPVSLCCQRQQTASMTPNGVNDNKRCQRHQTVSMTTNCVNDTKPCQWHQTISLWPNDHTFITRLCGDHFCC